VTSPPTRLSAEHDAKVARLRDSIAAARARGLQVRLGKSTSNLFRARSRDGIARVDARSLANVLSIHPDARTASVEGMITYAALVDATLPHALLPAVVPQLKTITVGGAVAGIGIESSSFLYGLVHETIPDLDILTGDGRIVACSPDQHPDLYFGFPNSYGSLGYATRLTVRLVPAAPYVHLTHERHSDPARYFHRVAALARDPTLHFLDGAVFSPRDLYLTAVRFSATAPYTSSYTWRRIYYQSIRSRSSDYLTARDYIWRWDTDWFWCSRRFGVQHPLVRLLATPLLLNSATYQRIMRLSQRLWPASHGTESVIQDVDIPIANAPAFLDFLHRDIGITPIWICPLQPRVSFPLYALDTSTLYINFGFWDILPSTHAPGFFNRRIEEEALALDGKKGLYSTALYDPATFARIYNLGVYRDLKRRYDPSGSFPDLYYKCVARR
jgi:FAD/FMN-containing dehydrogenase